MYNLAKLLLEEPAKIERFGLFFLKLLITVYWGSWVLNTSFHIASLVEKPIPNHITISGLLYVISVVIIAWSFIWNFIGEVVLKGIVFLLSLIPVKMDKHFYSLLFVLKVAKRDPSGFLKPLKNAPAFATFLNENFDSFITEFNDKALRIKQYFIISIILFITLIVQPEFLIHPLINGFFIYWLISFLIASVAFETSIRYMSNNIDYIKKQFSQLAYYQMVFNVMQQNKIFKTNYEYNTGGYRMRLKRKELAASYLPERINISPVYYWNDALTKEHIDMGLQQYKATNTNIAKGNSYIVIVSNVRPDNNSLKAIEKTAGLVYLYCENEEQTFKNTELFLFKVTQGRYELTPYIE